MTKEKILGNYQPIPYCGCHIWDSHLGIGGYGQVWFKRKIHRVHRLMYEFKKGPIPEGMVICHTCDTPSCVNPDHLFLGTQKDNIQDCINKGRNGKGYRGHNAGTAKLTEEQVSEIRSLLKEGVMHRKIAEEFGVVRRTVGDINTGRSWRWLK